MFKVCIAGRDLWVVVRRQGWSQPFKQPREEPRQRIPSAETLRWEGAYVCMLSFQSCPTAYDPMDYS